MYFGEAEEQGVQPEAPEAPVEETATPTEAPAEEEKKPEADAPAEAEAPSNEGE